MALANSVQNAMTGGKGDLLVGLVKNLVCAGTLFLAGRLLTTLFVRMPRLQQSLCGTPTVLINEGKMVMDKMRRENITEEELMTALRQHGLSEPGDAKLAVLEVDGSLSIVAAAQRPQSETRGGPFS